MDDRYVQPTWLLVITVDCPISSWSPCGNDAVKRIVIADDHEVVRSGLRAIVDTRSDWIVSGEATNGEQAVAILKRE